MPEAKTTEGTVESPLEKAINQDKNGFVPSFKIITVSLTFSDWGSMILKFLRQASEDVKRQKQELYDLKDDAPIAQVAEFRTNILAGLLQEEPVNMPDWPADKDIGFKQKFADYFSDPDNHELLGWIWSEYQEKLYPKELMSRLSD